MRMRFVVLLAVLATAGTAAALTPAQDGLLSEWVGPDVLPICTEPAPDGGWYHLMATWDASNLYLGMERNSSGRYLGTTGWTNDSFFVAVDVDGVPGSGASQDGYGRMDFGGTMRPDVFYAYAGGGSWYEWATWNGSGWSWQGWNGDGGYYGWQPANPDDELQIPLSRIGGSAEKMIWAWMTRQGNGWVEASWPQGYHGDDPNPVFPDGIMLPEPASLVLLLMGGLALLRRR